MRSLRGNPLFMGGHGERRREGVVGASWLKNRRGARPYALSLTPGLRAVLITAAIPPVMADPASVASSSMGSSESVRSHW